MCTTDKIILEKLSVEGYNTTVLLIINDGQR